MLTTGLQNSQHTCHRLKRGVDEAVANPPLIWRQVQIHPPFGFQSHLLEGYFANRVSYLLYWSLAACCLLAKSHSPLGQMEVCYLWTVENSALQTFTHCLYCNGFRCGSLRSLSYPIHWPEAGNTIKKLCKVRLMITQVPEALDHIWLNCLWLLALETAALLCYFLAPKHAKFIRILSEAKYLHWDDLVVKVSAEDL